MDLQNIHLNVFIRDGSFFAETEVIPDDRVSYAFYFYFNGVKIDQRWYTGDPKVVFPVTKNGVYYVTCFIKHGESPSVSKRSDVVPFYLPPQKTAEGSACGEPVPMDLSIFGSCVSRDLLEFDKEKKYTFLLKSYIARQTIISAVSKSVAIEECDINLSSAFQRRMVLQDFRKDTFELLRNDRSEYLILDLIEERFLPVRYGDSFVTFSSLLQQTSLAEHIQKTQYVYDEKDNKYYFEGVDLDGYLLEFCRSIRELFEPDKIILHKAKCLPIYRSKEGQFCAFPLNTIQKDAEVNKRLEYISVFLEKHLGTDQKKIFVIDICDDYYASEAHKWGLSTMHYCDDYYIQVLEIIRDKIIRDRTITQQPAEKNRLGLFFRKIFGR